MKTRFRLNIGISEKLIFTVIFFMGLLIMISGYYSLRFQKETLLSEFDEKARIMVNSLAVSSEYAVLTGNNKALENIGILAISQKNVVFCEIKNNKGDILFRRGNKASREIRGYSSSIMTEKVSDVPDEMMFMESREKEYDKIGEVYLALSLADLSDRINKQTQAVITLVVLGIGVAFFLISLLIKFLLGKPIEELIQGTKKISSGELTFKVKVKSNDEIGLLASSFNKMTEDLQKITVSRDDLSKEIEERKRMSDALRRSEERFSQVAANSGDWIWEFDKHGRYTYSSPTVRDVLGYESTDILWKYYYDFFVPEDRGPLKEKYERIISSGDKLVNTISRRMRQDGKVIILEENAAPVFDTQKNLIGYRGVDRDITERVHRQEEEKKKIARSVEYQKTLLELARLEQSASLTMQAITEASSKALGVDRVSVWFLNDGDSKISCDDIYFLGQNIHDKGTEFDLKECPAYLKALEESRCIAANNALEDARTVEFKDSYLVPYGISSMLDASIRRGGKLVGVLCHEHCGNNREWVSEEQDFATSVADLISLQLETTERKRAEEELKGAYDQLKSAQAQLVQSAKMASVGLLAGGVAHEINNPLTGVLNNVQLIRMLAEQKSEFSIDEFKELLGIIEESALRCRKITQSLLDFSHASKGVFQPVSLNEVADKVATLIHHELKLQNIVIQKELEEGLPPILGDNQLVQQVVFDIISNAKWAIQKKSSKEGGTITLKTIFDKKENKACIHIFDTGVGIARENLEKIFEPFFTTKPVGEGTGLGLSIVYNIIKAHKATVNVESQIGEGTVFRVCFPLA
ncbi:MAG: PAS domain S-box protein [Candidatus Omnitrophica bacterium]|nr:PAS domain S-box protein [Candidatus Omnitrophota bacterium]